MDALSKVMLTGDNNTGPAKLNMFSSFETMVHYAIIVITTLVSVGTAQDSAGIKQTPAKLSWQPHTVAKLPSRHTLSGCCARAIEAATLSAMPCQGLRWGMRSLKAISSKRAWMFFTSLLNAGIDLRNAASTDLHTQNSVVNPRPSIKVGSVGLPSR